MYAWTHTNTDIAAFSSAGSQQLFTPKFTLFTSCQDFFFGLQKFKDLILLIISHRSLTSSNGSHTSSNGSQRVTHFIKWVSVGHSLHQTGLSGSLTSSNGSQWVTHLIKTGLNGSLTSSNGSWCRAEQNQWREADPASILPDTFPASLSQQP